MTALARKPLRLPSSLTPSYNQLAWGDIDQFVFTSAEYERLPIAQQIHDQPSGKSFIIHFLLVSPRSHFIKNGSDVPVNTRCHHGTEIICRIPFRFAKKTERS
jgi:hypothetical protein